MFKVKLLLPSREMLSVALHTIDLSIALVYFAALV